MIYGVSSRGDGDFAWQPRAEGRQEKAVGAMDVGQESVARLIRKLRQARREWRRLVDIQDALDDPLAFAGEDATHHEQHRCSRGRHPGDLTQDSFR